MLAFFRAHVGSAADPALAGMFNPQFELPSIVADVTRIDRGYTDSADSTITRTFDDFDRPSGFNSSGAANTLSNVSVIHGGIANHSSQQRVAQIAWKSAGPKTYFQSNWTAPGLGQDVRSFKTLDFRVARQCGDAACSRTDSQWLFATSFSVRLVGADGSVSNAIPISNYITLTGPVGGLVRFIGSSPHPILQTIRVQLSQFGSAGILANLRGVRFTFDDTKSDEIFIGNIRLSSVSDVGAAAFLGPAALAGGDSMIDDGPAKSDVNDVKSIRSVSANQVEIELTSNREFLPQGELLVLRIGASEFTASRYPQTGETGRVSFTLTAEQFAQLQDGAAISVQYGEGHDDAGWRFGKLNKAQLAK